jgi:hypothetical protein
VGARLEYEQFNIPNTRGAKIASLSVFLTRTLPAFGPAVN